MKYGIMILLLAGAVFTGCNSSGKTKILGIDTMRVVMWDMLRADELYNRILIKDSAAATRKENIRLYKEVFLVHKITKGQFDSSYKYYASHPVEYKILIDSLDALATRERNKAINHGQGH